MKTIIRFVNDDSGADLVEYALLVGVVALGATVTLTGIRNEIIKMFQYIEKTIRENVPAATS